MGWLGVCHRGEHRSNPTEINVRHVDANRHGSNEHQKIFQNTDPGHSSYAADKNKPCDEHDGNHHRLSAANTAETRYFNDNSKSRKLQLKIWNDGRDPD